MISNFFSLIIIWVYINFLLWKQQHVQVIVDKREIGSRMQAQPPGQSSQSYLLVGIKIFYLH